MSGLCGTQMCAGYALMRLLYVPGRLIAAQLARSSLAPTQTIGVGPEPQIEFVRATADPLQPLGWDVRSRGREIGDFGGGLDLIID
jgi:hypothetical protein